MIPVLELEAQSTILHLLAEEAVAGSSLKPNNSVQLRHTPCLYEATDDRDIVNIKKIHLFISFTGVKICAILSTTTAKMPHFDNFSPSSTMVI